MRSLARLVVVALGVGVGLALVVGVVLPTMGTSLSGAFAGRNHDLGQLEELAQRSVVHAADGSVLAVLHAEENRVPVPLDRVPDHVVNAILDVEDERFWLHGGVDLRSTLRALATNVSAGEVRQGGSTITQQLVKNAFLTPERDLDRKVKEAVLAVRLEDRMSKREILERYLNTVYFGNGAYGVQAAAETYFNRGIETLDVAQAAFLAGLIRNPVGYDPFRHPERAKQRRDLALDRMVENGHLSSTEATPLRLTPLPAALTEVSPPPDYFVEEVKQRLLDDPRLGDTPQQRYNALFKGGLQITTTLDPRLQTIAKAKVAPPLLPDTAGSFTAALVSVEPSTGAVRAMVGGPNFEQAKYNLVTQGTRQPGSSFKPFVLVAAIEAGIGPNHTVDGSSPCSIPNPGGRPNPWQPSNYEGTRGGVGTVTEATARSLNCAYARLGRAAGLERVADVARRMGITTKLDTVPSMSLGTEEVRPLDMASAYATLANDGVHHEPYFVQKVTDRNGKVLFEGPSPGERVISEQHARVANQILRAVVERGTGTRARLPGRPVAGKTGTSQEWQNAWFVGFTPQLSTAVWMGSPVGNVSMYSVGGVRVTGGSYPARIWGAYMEEALEGQPVAGFPAPDPRSIPKGSFVGERSRREGSETRPSSPVRRRSSRAPSSTAPPETGPSSPPPSAPEVSVPRLRVPFSVPIGGGNG